MASISASTTHRVGVKKTVPKAKIGGGILKTGVAGKSKLKVGAGKGAAGVGRRGSVAPQLTPSDELNHPAKMSAYLALEESSRRERVTSEFLPKCSGERAAFTPGGMTKPHTASTTRSRGQAAADIALVTSRLGPAIVLKKWGVLAEVERTLLPDGMGKLFSDGKPGSGAGMRRIASAVSMASASSGGANYGDSTMSMGSGATDSKRGKTAPPAVREGALLLLRALCEVGTGAAAAKNGTSFSPRAIEPYVVPLLAAALDECGSSSSSVREAAEDASTAIVAKTNPLAVSRLIVPILFEALKSPEWRVKCAALDRMKQVCALASKQVSKMLPEVVPTITGQIWDTKANVSKSAREALLAVCQTNQNPDVAPALPAVINAVCKPADTFKAVEELMATTFVSTVDASTLSILCPILSRGLKEKNATRKRACCVVIENMSRLVDHPASVAPFGPLLVPELKKVVEQVQFEDIRDIAMSALQALTRALGHADVEAAMAAVMRAEADRVEEEQRRIDEALEEERLKEEEMNKLEVAERKLFKEAMEAQRLLDNLALDAEEAKKEKEMLKKEQLKKSTKNSEGKCGGCGLKKCKKTCLFFSK